VADNRPPTTTTNVSAPKAPRPQRGLLRPLWPLSERRRSQRTPDNTPQDHRLNTSRPHIRRHTSRRF